MHLYSLSRILTITLVVVAIVAVSMTIYIAEENAINSYSSKISYKITKLPVAYDYTCDADNQQVNVVLTNNGTKAISDFSITVSNPVCVAAVPSLPSVFNQSSTLKFSVFSTNTNGTITVAGNYTLVIISF